MSGRPEDAAAIAPCIIAFHAAPMAVRDALAEARSFWQAQGLAAAVCDTGEQVLAEVLNNVVEHAQTGRPEGQVEVETSLANGGLICWVRDDGVPMPDGLLCSGPPVDIGDKPQDLPEGGFGCYIIRSLAEDLAYRRKNGWNHLRFRISELTIGAEIRTY